MLFTEIWGADSGDIVSAIFTRGSIHPPGYPIYYLLGQLFRFLPWGTPAQRIGLISLLFSLLTLWVVKSILGYIVEKLNLKLKNKEKLLFVPALVFLFFGYLWLIYSLVPEIFTTSIFFILINSYYLLRYLIDKRSDDHRRFLLTFLVGFFFQYVILLNLFVYLVFQFRSYRKLIDFYVRNWPYILAFLLISVLPYFLFYIVWDRNSIIYWQPKSIVNLFHMLTRSEYGFLSTALYSYQSFTSKLFNLKFYFLTSRTNFTYFGLILAGAGFHFLFRKHKLIAQILGLLFFLYGPLLVFYMDIKSNSSFSQAILERFVLFSCPFVVIFIYFGFISLRRQIIPRLKDYINNKSLYTFTYFSITVMLIGILPFFLMLKNVAFIRYLSDNQYFRIHAQNLLRTVPKNSLLILYEDTFLFPAEYYRYVLGQYSEVILVSHTRLFNPDYYQVLKKKYPKLQYSKKLNLNFYSEFIKLNLKSGRRIFTNVDFDDKKVISVKYGLLYELVLKSERIQFTGEPNIDWQFLQTNSVVYPVYFLEAIKDWYSRQFYELGLLYKEENKLSLSETVLSKGYAIQTNNHDLNVLFALILYKRNKCRSARNVLTNDFSLKQTKESAFILSRLSAVCFKDRSAYLFWNERAKSLSELK